MVKLIAIDLDGTLLRDDKTISKRNKEALRNAKESGIKVVLCTGRPLAAIHHFVDELGLNDSGDYSITFNGGLVQKNDTGEIIEKKTLSMKDIYNLHQLAASLNVPFDVLSDNHVLGFQTSEHHQSLYPTLTNKLIFEPYKLEMLEEDRIYNKALVAADVAYLDQQISKIPKEFFNQYEIMKTREILLEFMPKGVTKAYGLSLLAKDLNIQRSEIMGLGDEENDLAMIEYAGIGVAMENATQQVKKAADAITDTNNNDGVAKAIERFVLNPLKGVK